MGNPARKPEVEPASLAVVLSLEALAALADRDDATPEVLARFRDEFNPRAMRRVFAALRELATARGARWSSEDAAKRLNPARRPPGGMGARAGADSSCATCGGDRANPAHTQIRQADYHAFARRPR